VGGGVEGEVGHLEPELRLPVGHGLPLAVPRVEAEVGPAGEVGVVGVGAGGRVDPAAAGDEPGARVVDDDVLVRGLAGAAEPVEDGEGEGVDAGLGVGVGAGDGASVHLAVGGGAVAPVPG